MTPRDRQTDGELEIDGEIGDLLRQLDHPLPALRATDVMRRATSRRWVLVGRAAAVMLVVGMGGVAWAAPGSPLPRLVANVRSWMSGARTALPSPTRPAVRVAAEPPASAFAGVAVTPGPRLLIVFLGTQERGNGRVKLDDVPEVSVRTSVGGATFTSTDSELRIDNRGSTASFEIVIPRPAARVEIRVDGRRVLLKDGASVVVPNGGPAGSMYEFSLTRAATNRE